MNRIFASMLCILCLSCGQKKQDLFLEQELAKEVFTSLKEDYQLYLMDHQLLHSPKLKKIAVDFCHYGEIDIRQARLIIHRTAQLLLENFNHMYPNPEQYHHYPLTKNDLEITVSFVDPSTHKMHTHGAVAHVSLIGGQIHYSAYVEKEQSRKTVLQELYSVLYSSECKN